MKSYKVVILSVSALVVSGLVGGVMSVDSLRTGVVETTKGTYYDTKNLLGFGGESIAVAPSTPSVDIEESHLETEVAPQPVIKKKEPSKKLTPSLEIIAPNTRGNTLIARSGNNSALVDGGYSDDSSYLQSSLSRNGVNSVKYLVSTTYKNSSIDGLSKKVSYGSPDYILTYKRAYTYQKSKNFKSVLNSKGLVWSFVKKPSSYGFGKANLTLVPLNSDGELGVQLEYKGKVFFSSGDITRIDKRYLDAVPLGVDVYLIAHSSKGYRLPKELFTRLKPKTTVVNTQYRLDSRSLVKQLKSKQTKVVTQQGARELHIVTDGKDVSVTKNKR